MKKALLVCRPEQNVAQLRELLVSEGCEKISAAFSAYGAEEAVHGGEFDLICINAPLVDENGIDLSRRLAEATKAVVVILVPQKNLKELGELLAPCGVLAAAKPLNRQLFHLMLSFAAGMRSRFIAAGEETERLKGMVEDIKIIDRAKLLLVSCLNMSEEQAHRYLEKQAMDLRTAKVDVAKQVIQTYEN